MCAQAGEIPSSGETIVFSGYRFTVVSNVEVTTKQQYHFFVHRNDRSEQRFLLYIRQMCFDKILKSAGLF